MLFCSECSPGIGWDCYIVFEILLIRLLYQEQNTPFIRDQYFLFCCAGHTAGVALTAAEVKDGLPFCVCNFVNTRRPIDTGYFLKVSSLSSLSLCGVIFVQPNPAQPRAHNVLIMPSLSHLKHTLSTIFDFVALNTTQQVFHTIVHLDAIPFFLFPSRGKRGNKQQTQPAPLFCPRPCRTGTPYSSAQAEKRNMGPTHPFLLLLLCTSIPPCHRWNYSQWTHRMLAPRQRIRKKAADKYTKYIHHHQYLSGTHTAAVVVAATQQQFTYIPV